MDENDLEEKMKQIYRPVTKVDVTNWNVGPYKVHLGNKGFSCDCPHWTFRWTDCRHIKSVRDYNRNQ